MNHASTAETRLKQADGTSGDHLNSAQEGILNALTGIGYALLDVADAIREQTAAEYERQAIVP